MTAGPPSAPFASVRLELAKLRLSDDVTLRDACEKAARISAETLRVARVGIWLFEDGHERLRCMSLHVRRGSSSPILELSADDYPSYMAALVRLRWIAASDARADPLTRELAPTYLEPQGIVAMLDAPIFRGSELFGIVCHEHDEVREWTDHDRAFAGTIADIVALVFEQAAHLSSERSRRALEAERRHAQKLEVLARFALSMAHDVNNVLTTVRLLVAPLVNEERTKTVAREVLGAVDTGATLTRELLRIAQQQPRSLAEPTDLVTAVAEFSIVLRAVVRGQATLTTSLPDAPILVDASESQIQQILLNLVVNARDAVQGGGRIEIQVDPLDREGRDLVRLRISDNGSGIPDDVRARLFEPFFTTKPGGTGWGLTLVREIVDALGGSMEVESRFGKGTSFDVLLPLADVTPTLRQPRPPV